ncbi:BTH_I0359 family protein [Pseudaquabacterium pictum]|uniref:DUF3567 domain-containing protein n=1 Tax=Pseudaquabacterium pictum TaxID=2315236 RepID=A0A480AWX2_9BURK|nr:DUF3567 domain-containing protein [Rubrivivax pictus]GCL64295.1 hypothetical protein AQPW35_33760 [Rubrivivax pictus]
MQTLYNSDSFVVVSFDLPGGDDAAPRLQRGGFEIVDKLARKEIFIEGALAEHFKQGVQALVDGQAPGDADALHALIDDYIAGYTALAQQPVVLH